MKQKGFTLIEMLLVVTLLAISIGVTGDILITVVRSYNKTNTLNELEQQANFLGLKLEKELRNASSIDPSSDTNTLIMVSNGTAVSYDITANNVFRNTGGASTQDATTALLANTPLANLSIPVAPECPSSADTSAACGFNGCFNYQGTTPQRVNICIRIKNANSSDPNVLSGSVLIKNTVVLRNSY